jgi:large subunit ribosomal protein L1
MKRSKKYKKAVKQIDKSKEYDLNKALDLLDEISYANFDESVELVISLNIKDKQKKESVRGSITFPNSLGDPATIAVIAEKPDQKKAEEAGADFVGLDDLIKKIEEGFTDFDILIATPEVMQKVAKLGKHIGRLGLMPNPKTGTVTKNVGDAVKSFKAGKTNYKMNSDGTFQLKVANMSMDRDQILENIKTFTDAVNRDVKRFGEDVYDRFIISTTMSPAIKIDAGSVLE